MSPESGAFSVGRQEDDRRVVFAPRGELDLATAPDFEAAIAAALDGCKPVFMDSSGVRVLITAHARAGDHAERLTLVRPAPGGTVERILEIAGVEQALKMVDEAGA